MRRALAIVLLTLTLLKALSLTQLWSYNAGGTIEGLAFSDNGNLGASSWDNCAYIFDPNGKLLNKVCGIGDMDDASYSNGRFGFINHDDYAYITDERGNLIKKIHVGDAYDSAITMTSNGFVACWSRCALFDFNGNELWDVDVGRVENGPSYYKGYWYVADIDWKKLLIIKDGSIVKEINYGENALDTAVCGKYLAVSTATHLYLYDLSDPTNPREIWKRGGLSGCGGNGCLRVTFSPDCKYIAVADTNNYKLKIYDINGNLVLEKEYDNEVWSVAWWMDRIAVGLNDGGIYVYKVEGYTPQLPQSTQTFSTSQPFQTTLKLGNVAIKPFLVYRQEFSQVPIIGKILSAALSKAIYGKVSLDALYASYQAYLKTLGLAQGALREAESAYYKGDYLKALIKILETMTYLKISNITYNELMKTWNTVKNQMSSLNYNVPVPKIIKELCGVQLNDWDSDSVIKVLSGCIETGPEGVKLVKLTKPYGGLEAFAGSLVLKDLQKFGKSLKELAPRQSELVKEAKELKEEIELVLGG